MVRLLLLAVLLLGGGFAFKNQWLVLNWQKVSDDLGLNSLIDYSIFNSSKKSPSKDKSPSR
jgi:hypothetical protein